MKTDELAAFIEASEEAAQFLRVLGNANRLLILCRLLEYEEMPVNILLEDFAISQSALSQHLARMREEGLVTYRREAQTLYYRIADEKVFKIVSVLKEIFCP